MTLFNPEIDSQGITLLGRKDESSPVDSQDASQPFLKQDELALIRTIDSIIAFVEGTLIVAKTANPGSQSGAVTSLQVLGSTVNAATTAIDTGYKPTPGHIAKLDGGLSLTDRTAQTGRGLNANAIFANYGGLSVRGAPVIGGGTGDAFAGATIVFSVSMGGTLVVTLTPPGGYVGTIEWECVFTLTEN